MSRMYDVAVLNAASLAGETLLSVLADSNLKLGTLYPLADITGEDAVIEFKGTEIDVLATGTFNFADADLLFIPVGSKLNSETIEAAKQAGCLVINGSESAEGQIVLSGDKESLVTAGEVREAVIPGSAAVLLLEALKPLQAVVGIDSVNVVANLSVANTGKPGFDELRNQTIELLSGKPVKSKVFSHRIAFNMIPEVGAVDQDGTTEEERRLTQELAKGLGEEDLRVSATCVRVPTFFGDSLAVHLDLDKPVDAGVVRDLLAGVNGVDLYPANEIPTVEAAAGNDQVLIGRIRQNAHHPDQLSLWVVGDSVRYWAIQSLSVAEILLKDFSK